MGECLGVGEVVEADNLDVSPAGCPEREATDAPESVDSDRSGHGFSFLIEGG
jgi:hypothetical protein